jgi:hypothetical protein
MSTDAAGSASGPTSVTASRAPAVVRGLCLLLVALALPAMSAGQAGAQDQQKDDARRRQEAARQAQLQRQRALEAERAAAAEAQMRALVAGQQARPAWPDEQFERYVFQQDQTADRARKKFESLLASRVDEIERTCELTLTQVRKLRLMGRGDIKRFFDAYETVKARFKSFGNDVNRLQEIQADLAPLRLAMQGGPFHEDSLLYKSLRNTLTDEQFAKYDAMTRERRAFRHRANIELAVTMLEQAMPLRDGQRRELIALLEKETKPSRKASQYESYLILYQVGRLPDAKFKALLSDTQKVVLDRQLAQYAALIPNLRQSGLVSDEDLAEPPPAGPK